MRYKNTKTGAIVDSSSKIVGKNWKKWDKEAKEKETKSEVETTETDKNYIEEELVLDDMNKKELIDFAKENKITINEKDTKAVIIETIAKSFE